MTNTIDDVTMSLLGRIADRQPHPLVFATVSGAHLYGFPSADSDFDLRGIHVLPLTDVIGLAPARETIEAVGDDGGLDMDLVTHDLKKFLTLLLRPNGYVLEQLTSPLVVRTSAAHAELLELVPRLVTRRHAGHYLGFAASQQKLFEKGDPRRAKPLLYVYRVLLTGTHLMRTGEVQANLRHLHGGDTPLVRDLLALKTGGREKEPVPADDLAHHEAEVARLTRDLEAARDASTLPDAPPADAAAACEALLRRVRLDTR